MKKTNILLVAFAIFAALFIATPASAGEITLDAVDSVNAETGYLFGDSEIQLEALGYYLEAGGAEFSGGGVGIGFFFNEYVGLRGQGIFGSDLRVFTGDVVLRYPVEDLGLAPYIYGGGGAAEFNNAGMEGLLRAGGGLEWRLTPGLGIFGEADYNWSESGGADFPRYGFGVRLNF